MKADDRWQFILTGLAALAMVVSLCLVFAYVPTERVMGPVQRIFYFHVPVAWVAFLAFLVACAAGLGYLLRQELSWDALQVASAEIGVVFSTAVLMTGSLWAKPIWNTWWTWDPRLTTTLIMWLYYVASLMLRNAADGEERKARFSALLNIIGFVNVPIVFLAIRLWRTIHPILFSSEGFGLEPSMLLTLIVCLATFTLLYACLLGIRMRAERLASEVRALRRQALARADEWRGGLR
jgi:heme exporter protein C